MRLSIIIPFHQGIHFLEDCLESIRDQDIIDFETILIVDHIKEDITPLRERYADIHIRIIELTDASSQGWKLKNETTEYMLNDCSGVAHARNVGLKEAKGEYVYFLDSDDYILSGTLPRLLEEMEVAQADFTYGKRVGTWFGRKAYLSSIQEALDKKANQDEKENQDQEDQEDQDLETDGDIITEEDLNLDENMNMEVKYIDHGVNVVGQQVDETGAIIEPIPIKLTRREKKIIKIQQRLTMYQEVTKSEDSKVAEAYYSLLIVKKGIKNLSVLGIMFRKAFLDQNQFQFNEDYMFYTDPPFVIKALKKVTNCAFVSEAIYVKRKHNDPIHYPALTQVKSDNRFEEFIQAYHECRSITDNDSALRVFVENKFISYFTGTYAPLLRRSENDLWRNRRLEIMRSCMKDIDQERIRSLKGYKKKIVRALLYGKKRKLLFHVNIHLAKKKIKKIKKNKRLFAYYLYNHYFTKMSMKDNWVMCESFLGKNYSDSPKYIYEYLSTKYPGKYRFIWIINKKGTKIPYKHTKVKRFSIRYCYYLARSKYDIFNMRQPDWMRKREENIFLETWHGTPLKKLVFDQEEVMGATPLYKAQVYKQSRQWDYLVSANHFSTEVFKSAFLFDKEIIEYGYPRNDILHHPEKDQIGAKIRKKLGVPINKKTILYAPTWRDDEYYGRGEYKFALKLDLHYMRRILGENYVILLRTHYFIADALDTTGLDGFAWNVSKYDDISELYLISDLLITDYSSVFFDYANLKRPILFYTYDLDKYRDMLRGFYMDIEQDVPGPLLFTSEEVVDAIEDIQGITKKYQEKYDAFYERFCSLEDGHASEKVAKRVFELE